MSNRHCRQCSEASNQPLVSFQPALQTCYIYLLVFCTQAHNPICHAKHPSFGPVSYPGPANNSVVIFRYCASGRREVLPRGNGGNFDGMDAQGCVVSRERLADGEMDGLV
ncbi:hypothetical protein BU23DRAFT_553358 [Bimuria novae-zelandiae CBS 107.79]|uniref:Uncharacterized protein n=1 Tax=Bimuria novae-zelandiae CBS 107.79 TaxID=1447943 RepID=A0A6A5VAX5_9PLEO|nr:hypothetical protein BU23DRAFT_553358 [Bimuria novae-zelandiae CBS 107.79]